MQIALRIYRVSNYFHRNRMVLISKSIDLIVYFLFNCSIPGSALIGRGTKLSKGGIALVIHERAVIGKNCVIGSCVTIGGRSKHWDVPVIGDNVYLGTGSKILGPISIESDVVVGANSVVLSSVMEGSVVAGVPAKVIKSGIKMQEVV